MARGALLVFAKAPVPGQVFQRLTPPLTPEEAAGLHMELTEALLQRIAHSGPWRTRLYATPTTCDPFLEACTRRHRIPLRPQKGRDLGERLYDGLSEALASDGAAVAVGTDLPELGAESIGQALQALSAGHDAVIQPTEDGGYGLIGLSRPLPQLFWDMPWGTGDVAGLTRQRLEEAAASWAELPTTWDVDRPCDLYRLYSSTDPGSPLARWLTGPLAGRSDGP